MADKTWVTMLVDLSFAISALVFNLVLDIIFFAMGSSSYKKENRSFGILSIVILLGNFITCFAYCLRHVVPAEFPHRISFCAYLFAFLCNILLTFYFSRYLESYFGGGLAPKAGMKTFNNSIVVFAVLFLIAVYIRQYPLLDGTGRGLTLPGWIYAIIAYLIELYFFLYAFVFFLRRRKALDRRSAWTVTAAFCVSVGAVVLEAFNPTGIQLNYFGVTLGLYLFYFGTETPDYKTLMRTLEELEEERRRADRANSYKSEFLANMSHEIRTPVNAVLGMDTIILRESKEPAIREYAMDIKNASQTLLSLINDILDLAKIESGKLEILPVSYDLGSLLYDITNMISMKAQNKQLNISLQVDEQLPSGLYGDDIRIRQILVNLMNNAVKYTEKGSVTLVVQGTQFLEDTVRLHFEVRDTGSGIREEDIGKLFAAYERIEEEKNRSIEGTGLGMSITTKLLHMMGSGLQVESEYGKGSVFSFDLTQGVLEKEAIGNIGERIKKQSEHYSYQVVFQAPEAEILVVDDNAMNRKVFQKLLAKTRVQMDEASSGEECLERVKEKHYDLIFMDHMMPGMDGIQTMRRMKESGGHLCLDTPVIMLTANAIFGVKEKYLSEGFRGYLSKPVDPDKLEKVIMEELPAEKVVQEKRLFSDGEEETQAASSDFPEIEGIEWPHALKKMKSEELLMETVHDFYALDEAEALELKRFWEKAMEGDMEALAHFRIKVHSMKSSAALIGAMGLFTLARILEQASIDENIDLIRAVAPVFIEEWREMKEKLKVLVSEESEGQKEPEYLLLLEYLRRLKSAISDIDIDTADEIVKCLKEYKFGEEVKGLIDEIALAVVEIDEAKTVELADRLHDIFSQKLEK